MSKEQMTNLHFRPRRLIASMNSSSKTANSKGNAGLAALTAAALILPGLLKTQAEAADGDEVDFQYSHFQEGKRELFNTVQNFNPIEVDTVKGSSKITLTDRIKFAFNYTQDTWGGATPISTAPLSYGGNKNPFKTDANVSASPIFRNQTLFLDKSFKPKIGVVNETTGAIRYVSDKQLVHTLSVASPETRKQGDFKLSYAWDEAAIDIGGGISIEDDYESRFGSLAGRIDFNDKQTTLNLGLSYTNSDTSAIPDHDLGPYAEITAENAAAHLSQSSDGKTISIHGNRQDWGVEAGFTQVLNKNALLQAGMVYTRSTGYLSNPYKYSTFIFADPKQSPPSPDSGAPPNSLLASGRSLLEQRPDERNQFNWTLGYKHYVAPLSAAFQLNYTFFHDDWKIDSHAFKAEWIQPLTEGWTITPGIRYYSQDAASFYRPYFLSRQADPGRNGAFDAIVPAYFSSDHRLSSYGALSGGVIVSKQFAHGVSLDAGFEYYTHQGALKLGGGGEGRFADFDNWTANAALKVDLSQVGQAIGRSNGHAGHHEGNSHAAPAGVMFAHTLAKAGDWMAGYRYMYSLQGGNMLHGSRIASERALQNRACMNGPGRLNKCFTVPDEMNMHMHMLDMMVAPTDWLTLMLMPQFVDMSMTLRPGVSIENAQLVNAGGHIEHHLGTGHETGGVGDTGMYGLIKLWNKPQHQVNLGLGLSAPTGDVGIKLRRNHTLDGGFIHYGMQLGSGTWDFKPSLTYTGSADRFTWGAQAAGTKRIESRNKSGFTFGDIFQGTVWGGYRLKDWLTASVRGVYTWQGAIRGRYTRDAIDFKKPEEECPRFLFEFDDGFGHIIFDAVSYNQCLQGVKTDNKALLRDNDAAHRSNPADFPANYGGHFVDLGLGFNLNFPGSDFAGHTLSFEWLEPIYTEVNGYQLDRAGALSLAWHYGF